MWMRPWPLRASNCWKSTTRALKRLTGRYSLLSPKNSMVGPWGLNQLLPPSLKKKEQLKTSMNPISCRWAFSPELRRAESSPQAAVNISAWSQKKLCGNRSKTPRTVLGKIPMSGHSKWSQIKHKKALTDKKKGQIFSKLSRLITLAAKKGTDPKSNPSLAQAIENARAVNMPNDNIERAIKKVSEKDQTQLEELSIEALGPSGVALKIRAITDNRNRTMAEIKKILTE